MGEMLTYNKENNYFGRTRYSASWLWLFDSQNPFHNICKNIIDIFVLMRILKIVIPLNCMIYRIGYEINISNIITTWNGSSIFVKRPRSVRVQFLVVEFHANANIDFVNSKAFLRIQPMVNFFKTLSKFLSLLSGFYRLFMNGRTLFASSASQCGDVAIKDVAINTYRV